jgi:hypothetical protein
LGWREGVEKTLRDSIVATEAGFGAFIAQATYDTRENHEREILREQPSAMDLEGVLVQADALHTQKPIISSSRSRGPTSFPGLAGFVSELLRGMSW